MERRYGFAARTNWASNRSNGSKRSSSLRISPNSEPARGATTRITNSTVTACRSDALTHHETRGVVAAARDCEKARPAANWGERSSNRGIGHLEKVIVIGTLSLPNGL